MSSPALSGQADDGALTHSVSTSTSTSPSGIDASSQQQIIIVTAFTVLTVGGFVALMGIFRWWFRRAGVDPDDNGDYIHSSPRPWVRVGARFLGVTEMRRLRTLVFIPKPSVTDLKLKHARNEDSSHWTKIQPLCAQLNHSKCDHKQPSRRSSLEPHEPLETPASDSIMVGAIIMMPTRRPTPGEVPVYNLPMMLGTSRVT